MTLSLQSVLTFSPVFFSSEVTRVEEFEDYIMIEGARLEKPFVEKPFEADDHNVFIYYPQADGGGCKKLFRKF